MGKDSSAAQALKQALALEQNGRKFYLGAAERTVDQKGKQMFKTLAGDEVIHAEIVQRQLDALAQGEGWALPAGVGEVDADLESPLFPAGKLELGKAILPDASDLDALLFALKIENDSFNLYSTQAKEVKDANARGLYEYLADAERTHFNLLMLNYESLSAGGHFA